MPSCYAVGAEKALIQAALRAHFSRCKGFIPKPSKSLFYCVTNKSCGIHVHSPTLKEKTLHEAIMTAIGSVVEDQGEFVQAFRENVIRVIGSYSASAEPTEYDKQIETLQQKMLELIEESAGKQAADEDFDKEYCVIADRMKELKKQKAKKLKERQLADAYGQRVKDMEQYMKKAGYLKREFDDELVRRLLKTVRVINENKIEIQFQSGIMITQNIDFNV